MARTRDFRRTDRVAASVQKALAAPVNDLARDTIGALATVTAVELAPDLRRGTVFLSVYAEPARQEVLLAAVRAAAHELQQAVATALRMRRTPVLSFRLDDTIERGDRINRLLRSPGQEG